MGAGHRLQDVVDTVVHRVHPGQSPQRKTAKKNCTFEVPGVNIKVTVPCDDDD